MQPAEVPPPISSYSSSHPSVPPGGPAGGHDLPDPDHDDLGRDALARAMQRVIANTPPGWSTRLALTGEWGSGKTTVLQLLKRRLRRECRDDEDEDLPAAEDTAEAPIPLVLELSVWDQHRESDLVEVFYKKLRDGMEADGIRVSQDLQERMRTHGGWLPFLKKGLETSAAAGEQILLSGAQGEAYAAVAGWARSSAFEFAWGKLDEWLKVKKEEFAKHLLTLASHNKSVVVFIDDLDRADPRTIPQTLFALREILSWPNFTFVLAYDEEIISRALREYSIACGDRAEQFLEKIVDMSFPLSEPSAHGVERLAYRMMETCCPFIPIEVREEAAQFFPPNPRLTKLIARTLGALKDAAERHEPHELNWRAIIVQSILRVTVPQDLVQQIERHFLGQKNAGTMNPIKSLEEILGEQGTAPSGNSAASAPSAPPDPTSASSSSDEHPNIHMLRRLRATPGRLTPDAAQRLFEALYASRADDAPTKIRAEMSLLKEEPSFTQKEFDTLLASVTDGQDCSELLRVQMKLARQRGRRSALEVAWDLLRLSIEAYEARTTAMEEADQANTRWSASEGVGQVLTVLEALWTDPPLSEEVRRATAIPDHSQGLLLAIGLHAKDGELNPESGQCGRARQLAEAVVERADHPFRLYQWCEAHSSARLNQERVTTGLHRRAVDEALSWFRDRDVLVSALGHNEMGSWFIESPISPLYTTALVGKLIALFERFAASHDSHTRDAGARLAQYLFSRHQERADEVDSYRMHSPVWPSMWAAVCAAPTTPSFCKSIEDLRAWIVQIHGVDAAKFELPRWLNVPPGDGPYPHPSHPSNPHGPAGAGGTSNANQTPT